MSPILQRRPRILPFPGHPGSLNPKVQTSSPFILQKPRPAQSSEYTRSLRRHRISIRKVLEGLPQAFYKGCCQGSTWATVKVLEGFLYGSYEGFYKGFNLGTVVAAAAAAAMTMTRLISRMEWLVIG